ncbi:MAG: PH domain-containing protein [Pirellula sp.]
MNAPNQLDFAALERPSHRLLTYYLLTSLLTGPGVFIAIPALIIRYNTLRYRFEESGIRMQSGLFFRNEVVVAFRRVQDIHVSRNIIQRWLGIASVSIQTASGSATPEIVLEGMTNEDAIRDWLYERMRGAKGHATHTEHAQAAVSAPTSTNSGEQVTALLRSIRDNLSIMAAKNSRHDNSETVKPS